MVKRSRLVFALLLVALASRYFPMTIQGGPEEQVPTCLPASLPQEIIFEFNQTYREQTFDFSMSNLELNEFNSLTMFFAVTGDRSTSEGLDVDFLVNYSKVNFTINRLYQDNLEHNLSQTFAYPENFIGEMNITVACKGQTTVGGFGILVIHSSTIFTPITPPTLTQQLSSLPTVPDSFSVETSLLYTQRLNLLTAFYSFNETAEANITLTFVSNCSNYGFKPFIEFQFNGEPIIKKYFEANEFNSLSLSLYPKRGLNLLSLDFVYIAAIGLINVQDIQLSAFLFFSANDPTDIVYDLVKWESETLDHTFNLSFLRPETYSNEQIVTLKLKCKHIGTLFSPTITYQILAGTIVVHEGSIYSFEQITSLTLSTKFVSNGSKEELLLRLFMDQESTGTFCILNSSTITLDSLPVITNGCLEQLFASNIEITPPAFGMISFSFTDFFKATNYSVFDFTLKFNILSEYEEVFDYFIISLKLNNRNIMYLRENYQSTVNETILTNLYEGIYKIKFTLSLFGIKSPFSLQNITYQFLATSYERPDTYVFNWYNVDWILAIYGFLFLVLNEKIINRRGIKRKANEEDYDQPPLEEEEEKKRERNNLILQIFVSISTFCVFFILLYLFQLLHWSLISLTALSSYYLGTLVESVSFEKGKIKKLLVKLREFFDEVESFYDFFSKTIETLSRKSRKQMWRAVLISLIIGSLAVNVGLLFFVADKLQFITEEPNLFSFFFTDLWQAYYFLFACVIVSTLAIYYAIHFVRTMTFVEDNLRRTRTLCKTSILLLAASILCSNIVILGTIPDFSTLWTFSSPLFLFGVVKASNNFGEVLAEEEKDDKTTRIIPLKEYLRNGKVWTNKREMRQALSFGITTRTKWLKEKHSLQKKKLNGTIIWNITAGIQIPLTRLAELAKLTKKRTELLLLEILNEQPKLGKYYKEEQVFIKETTDDTIGTVKMTEDESPPPTEKKEEKGVTQSAKSTLSVIKKFKEIYYNTEGKDDIQRLSNLQLKFHLTTKEAETYLNFIKKGAGEKETILTSHDREFVQRAWKKIYLVKDKFQRNSSKNLMKEYYDKLSGAHNGFDDVVFTKEANETFQVIFLDYKFGDRATKYPWEYTPKFGYHLIRRELNRKQIVRYSKLMKNKSFPKSPKVKLGEAIVPQLIKKLFYDRNRQYHIIGNDWLIKFLNNDFKESLLKLVEKGIISKVVCQRMFDGLIEQNQVIGLAQNGHTLALYKGKAAIKIIDYCKIIIGNENIKISHEFFLPKFTDKNGKKQISIRGFSEAKNKAESFLNSLIEEIEAKEEINDDEVLVVYSKVKREFLLKLFNSKRLPNLQDFKSHRGLYGIDSISSNDMKNRLSEIKNQPNKHRGISWFYDSIQTHVISFLTNNDLKSILDGKEELDIYEELLQVLSDPESFFDTKENQYILSKNIFEEKPFDFFLFNSETKKQLIPPTFSFRKGQNPRTGIVLKEEKHGNISDEYMKNVVSIQMEDKDILMNFPFRWDISYKYYCFTQKGNRSTKISKAWHSWLKENKLPLPTGSSAKIPSKSVIALLFKWWRLQEEFFSNRILSNVMFIDMCEKNNLNVEPSSFEICSEEGDLFHLVKVTVTTSNNIVHKSNWKYFGFHNIKIRNMMKVLESVICDSIVEQTETEVNSINNIKHWVKNNLREPFNFLKDIF